jgi:predicted DNA-binding protein
MPAKRRAVAPVSPLNFRMPRELRARLRKFADARHLSESEALRLIVSDHLTEVDDEHELAAAERWQFKQALKTFRDDIAGKVKTVPWEELEQVFADARAKRKSR